MDIFNELPLKKREYMKCLFQNCTEEVKYYMTLVEVEEDTTLIKAGEPCSNIYMILSGKSDRDRSGRSMTEPIPFRILVREISLERLSVLQI